MTFCGSASSSAAAAGTIASSVAFVSTSGGTGVGAADFSIFGGSRMREIGGRIVVFFFTSPSAADFFAGFVSINETLSWCDLAAAVFGTGGGEGRASVFFTASAAGALSGLGSGGLFAGLALAGADG